MSYTMLEEETCPFVKQCSISIYKNRDEDILLVQRLRAKFRPNLRVSRKVSRAAVTLENLRHQRVESTENAFDSINDEIGSRILRASQKLEEVISNIDNLLSGLLRDREWDELMRVDLLRKCFAYVDFLVSERNRYIAEFTDELRDLEKERTTLVEACYKERMRDIKQLWPESFEKLYEKYLKNYNMIKLGNFRTYEDLRFKLVQFSGSLRQEFMVRVQEVKFNIKKNTVDSLKDKFQTAVETIVSDKVTAVQTTLTRFLDDSNSLLFDYLAREFKYRMTLATVYECFDLFDTQSKVLDEAIDSVIRLHDEAFEEIQTLLTNTGQEIHDTIMDSTGESIDPCELIAIVEDISYEIARSQRRRTDFVVVDVLSILNGIKEDMATIVNVVFKPTTKIIDNHAKRLTAARNVLLDALHKKLKMNDEKLESFENLYENAVKSLERASTENDVDVLEENCDKVLKNIEKRIRLNREREMDISFTYKELIEFEYGYIIEDIQSLISSFPPYVFEMFPRFSELSEDKCWIPSELSITSFKTAVGDFLFATLNCLTMLVSKLESDDLMENELSWAEFLVNGIDERFNKAIEQLDLRNTSIHNETKIKRLDEIKQHQNLIECLIKDTRELCENLINEANEVYGEFNRKKDLILENVKLKQSDIHKMSIYEMENMANAFREQIDLFVNEMGDKYESLEETVKTQYEAIKNSIIEFMKSIKTFTQGGNYSHQEVEDTINVLNDLKRSLKEKQMEIKKILRKMNNESNMKTKKYLLKSIKPLTIRLRKRTANQKFHVIKKLMDVSVTQEYLNLEKMFDSLYTKLHLVEYTFENENVVAEASKCWHELLTDANAFVDYFVKSYQDIKVLLKSKSRRSMSVKNATKSRIRRSTSVKNRTKSHFRRSTSLKNATKPKSDQPSFYDYYKSVSKKIKDDHSPRFLNNISWVVRQYISESQRNAADVARMESPEPSIIMPIYHETMKDVLKTSRAAILELETFWIFKLSEFFEFLSNELHVTEKKFKNLVLMTYHEEAMAVLTETIGSFQSQYPLMRHRLKEIREEFGSKLKVSHGHPSNIDKLTNLLVFFWEVYEVCDKALSRAADNEHAKIEEFMKNYEAQYPDNVMKAITFSVECHPKVKSLMERVNTAAVSPLVFRARNPDMSSGSEEILKTVSEQTINALSAKQAVENVIQYATKIKSGSVIWPDNRRLWNENVQEFFRRCQSWSDEATMFYDVERLKLTDWITNFDREVELARDVHKFPDYVDDFAFATESQN